MGSVVFVLKLIVGPEYVADLVFVELFEAIASRAQVLTGVKFCRFINEYFTDGCGHSKTAIGVNINLADVRLRSLTELLFGDPDGVFEGTTIGIDNLYLILRYRARAVKNNGEPWDTTLYFLEDVEAKWRRNEYALFVAGALCRGKLVSSV